MSCLFGFKNLAAPLAGLMLLGAVPGFAGVRELALGSESSLWLEGDSTLHPYSSTATRMSVHGSLEPSEGLAAAARGQKVKEFRVAIPVVGLRSGKAGLDKNMQKALKAERNPEVLFRLAVYETDSAGGEAVSIKAKGTLTVAGVDKPVDLEARASLGSTEMRVAGSKELFMTDFGIKPPTVMGVIRTNNRVVIHYRLVLVLEDGPAE